MSDRVRQALEKHNYELLGELGRGGMGVVYLAQHRKLGRRVAIKTLTPDRMSKENSLARFEREAKVFAAIRHPHIANLYEFDDEGPIAYLALEYIEGTDLEKERKRGRKWKPEEVAEIMANIADALDHTHKKGILHRDIKPGNILIERNTNRVVLTDFGLAKGETDDTLTAAGFAVGTPAYMAPEQITDRFGGKPDGRADLFSLATVAYEMLTQEHPFLAKDDLNTMRNIVNGKLTSIQEIDATVPKDLADIIENTLEKNPKDRVADAATLAKKLRDWMGIRDSQTSPPVSQAVTEPARPAPAPQPARQPAPMPARPAVAPAPQPAQGGGISKGVLIGIVAAAFIVALIFGVAIGMFVLGSRGG